MMKGRSQRERDCEKKHIYPGVWKRKKISDNEKEKLKCSMVPTVVERVLDRRKKWKTSLCWVVCKLGTNLDISGNLN